MDQEIELHHRRINPLGRWGHHILFDISQSDLSSEVYAIRIRGNETKVYGLHWLF